MKITTPFIFLLLFFSSCKERGKSQLIAKNHFAITKYIDPRDSFWYDIKKKDDQKLNLQSIEAGVDSLEFRFWVDNQLSSDNVFIFKYESNEWTSENIFFIDTLYDEESKKSISTYFKTKIDGTSFFKRHKIDFDGKFIVPEILKKYDFFSFPTQSSLKSYTGCCLDGVVYYFEIATKDSYKFAVYENPDCCKDKDIQNKIFLDFLDEFIKSLPENEYCWPMCSLKEKEE